MNRTEQKRTAPAKRAAKATKKAAAKKVDAAALRLEQFVSAYLVHFNGARAAREAGFSPGSARQKASELLARPDVQERVQIAHAAFLARNEATKDMVLARMLAKATADPRALTELHRGCCRYCWGKGFRYQFTPQEDRERREQHAGENKVRRAEKKPPLPYNEEGGVGYNPRTDPNPRCPECFGDGKERVVFKDTRDLPPDAALLFEGVEVTQHGLKIRITSPTDALLNVGKHLGMFAQKVKHAGGDEGDAPVEVGVVMIPAKAAGGDGDG
ncbi:terminase small subunit [Luteimonas saliphila]|uniref:terminase small subunit n=1 Tax=Luteimonas saliphila TaxID=2804919 RepID=UPI00192D723C|nr:terminase small subunit [Luteimonas saliphila]